jgi:hypothetical protein
MREIGLAFPAADAIPPILPDEARAAETAICRLHKGRIAEGLTSTDRYGQVYLCPVGRSFWRLSKGEDGMHKPLRFPKGL